MTAININQLGKLELRELFPLALVDDIQTEFFIEGFIFLAHSCHLCYILEVCLGNINLVKQA